MSGKRVRLSCNHICWVSWLSAYRGNLVNCPHTGGAGGGLCGFQPIVEIIDDYIGDSVTIEVNPELL